MRIQVQMRAGRPHGDGRKWVDMSGRRGAERTWSCEGPGRIMVRSFGCCEKADNAGQMLCRPPAGSTDLSMKGHSAGGGSDDAGGTSRTWGPRVTERLVWCLLRARPCSQCSVWAHRIILMAAGLLSPHFTGETQV